MGRVGPRGWTKLARTPSNVHSPRHSLGSVSDSAPIKANNPQCFRQKHRLKQDSTFSISFFFFVCLFCFLPTPNEESEVENNEHVLCSIIPKGHSPFKAITGTCACACTSFFLLFLAFQELRKQNTIIFLFMINSHR